MVKSDTIEIWFKRLLPSPFSIAILLTLLTFCLTLTFGQFQGDDRTIVAAFKSWKTGLWNPGLMRFLVQMMLMLVLGHVMALSPLVTKGINTMLAKIKTGNQALLFISVLSIVVGLFNWGLALIVSAIFARKIGEYAQENGLKINYPLIVATAYSSLMVWHGGISGSAPAKVAEKGHLKQLMNGVLESGQLSVLPESIDYSKTIFSPMNLAVMGALLICIPLALQFLNKYVKKEVPVIHISENQHTAGTVTENPIGAQKLDASALFIKSSGVIVLLICGLDMFVWSHSVLDFINPDGINLMLFGLCLSFHKHVNGFLDACKEAIVGSVGILIQFPLYFGIMGLMNASGLVQLMSNFFVSISNQTTFPIFSYISAGIVNVFVPSGGGQWGVQGPVIIQASSALGVDYGKSIMALAYGDQLTNMLQPFWALPLLGITKLKATDILPYTCYLFLCGGIIFGLALLIF